MTFASSTLLRLLALSCAMRQATAAFSLNVSGPNWDYTTKDFADTTSQACKDAYSASINCDDTLVSIVASLDPSFHPQASDLESMCTTTCSNSLDQYIDNVKAACNKPGDLAGVCDGNSEIPEASVAAVGEVLRYQYSQACSKDGSDYCYLTFPNSPDWAATEFPCSDTCAVQFYQNAHKYRGSAYFFSYEALCNQTEYWDNTFAGGWEQVVKCGDAGNEVTSVASVSVSASATSSDANVSSTVNPLSTTASIPSAAATTATETTASTTVSGTGGTSASTATSSRATSEATRIRAPFF